MPPLSPWGLLEAFAEGAGAAALSGGPGARRRLRRGSVSCSRPCDPAVLTSDVDRAVPLQTGRKDGRVLGAGAGRSCVSDARCSKWSQA